ncbi:MAG TPA: hypothetical protein VNE60_03480 [Gemmatimonadaceae bacterium]|nr:hypothetical protein [Gemmatimonadaceae bacterium]
MRRGVTAIEMAVTLCLLGLVLALLARRAASLERWQRALQASRQQAWAARQTLDVLAAQLAPIAGGDIAPQAASDSAVEAQAFVGTAVACMQGAELRVAGDAVADGPALASFVTPPRAGDRLFALDERGAPERWVERTVTRVVSGGAACLFVARGDGLVLALDAPLPMAGSALVAVRVARRTRFSLYLSGDGLWYLGLREWNADASRFAGIQPVAGPLSAYRANSDRSGLRFTYLDAAGRPLARPLALAESIGGVEIAARSDPGAFAAHLAVVLRDARP